MNRPKHVPTCEGGTMRREERGLTNTGCFSLGKYNFKLLFVYVASIKHVLIWQVLNKCKYYSDMTKTSPYGGPCRCLQFSYTCWIADLYWFISPVGTGASNGNWKLPSTPQTGTFSLNATSSVELLPFSAPPCLLFHHRMNHRMNTITWEPCLWLSCLL